ncbi:MAG: tRNA (adenosine(37)-N6)-threonylcarbamoyltransferase complex transferase subunit TsaD [Proteobacteria bacterium]|nr:tRNA (adenosine(37)-N6)-threonylcarbamoyltransferase complex transferase subunit TsaD [Pseudomonadota bacterium]
MKKFLILGIETSCDETAAAVMDADGNVLSNVVFSQVEMHNKYGGIVPELASRDHALKIETIVNEAILKAGAKAQDITHIGVANGPGLLGCLLVGLSFAKAFALSKDIPLIGVDHVRSHLLSVMINDVNNGGSFPSFPFAGLVVSGGHTSIYLVNSVDEIRILASTVDDAAGEVFDKVARFIGLEYPGGKVISDLAKLGNKNAVKFPKPVIKGRENDFSFSGLKTSVINYFRNMGIKGNVDRNDSRALNALAGFQEVICEILVDKLIGVAEEVGIKDIVIGGGVAANYRLREMFLERASKKGFTAWSIPIKYCTDNAAMIANYARLIVKDKKDAQSFTDSMSSISAYSTTRR